MAQTQTQTQTQTLSKRAIFKMILALETKNVIINIDEYYNSFTIHIQLTVPTNTLLPSRLSYYMDPDGCFEMYDDPEYSCYTFKFPRGNAFKESVDYNLLYALRTLNKRINKK